MKHHLMTLYALTTVSVFLCSGLASAAPAAGESNTDVSTAKSDSPVKAKTRPARKGSDSNVAGQTDIVANVDMPMVTNILPWQEKEGKIPKDILEFSALKDSLTPTDRDRLAGEIRYTSILNEPTSRK